jgi:hypothetical protein
MIGHPVQRGTSDFPHSGEKRDLRSNLKKLQFTAMVEVRRPLK